MLMYPPTMSLRLQNLYQKNIVLDYISLTRGSSVCLSAKPLT